MTNEDTKTDQKATFGGGCFWCLDAIFRKCIGVTSVKSGYSGGWDEKPNYDKIHTHQTGHVEAVQITFDSSQITYQVILEIFWTSHNPTTPNQDGANFGEQYRSVIFYHNEEQKKEAHKSLHDFAQKLWDNPIVTEILPYKNFFDAEDYHQDYYQKNSTAPYCQIIINPKLEKFQKKFAKYYLKKPLES